LTERLQAVRVVAVSVVLAACGGGGSPTNPDPPANAFRITIGANGVVSPTELTVPPGTRVLFTNNHTGTHDMTSDPHPEHNLCPELNQVGLLRPGESRETGNLVVVRSCGFHDHDDPDNRNLRGTIVIR
jgi:plastocyanin